MTQTAHRPIHAPGRVRPAGPGPRPGWPDFESALVARDIERGGRALRPHVFLA